VVIIPAKSADDDISRLYATLGSICRSVLLNERALNAIQQAQRMATLQRMASEASAPDPPISVPAEQRWAVDQRTKCYNPPLQIGAQGAEHP
jgi:hypothetical protein